MHTVHSVRVPKVRRGPRRLAAALTVASLGLSGCALLLVGAGAAGGYAISKDSVRNIFDLPRDRVYAQSLSVARDMGMVTLEDHARGLIEAEVQEVHVTITVRPVSRRSVELKVKARNLMPKIDTAQAIYTRILERL